VFKRAERFGGKAKPQTRFLKGNKMRKPYTVNTIYRDGEIEVKTYKSKMRAVAYATEETQWENTVHSTVTHEPSGKDIFDEAGFFN
jgi:hypothetical protein